MNNGVYKKAFYIFFISFDSNAISCKDWHLLLTKRERICSDVDMVRSEQVLQVNVCSPSNAKRLKEQYQNVLRSLTWSEDWSHKPVRGFSIQLVRLNILPCIKLILFIAKICFKVLFWRYCLVHSVSNFYKDNFFFLNFDFIIFVNSKITTCLRKVEMKSSQNWISADCVYVWGC